jgi:hypothetical protein
MRLQLAPYSLHLTVDLGLSPEPENFKNSG